MKGESDSSFNLLILIPILKNIGIFPFVQILRSKTLYYPQFIFSVISHFVPKGRERTKLPINKMLVKNNTMNKFRLSNEF